MSEKRNNRTRVFLIAAVLLVAMIVFVSIAFFTSQTASKPMGNGFWTLFILPSDPNFSAGNVEPNGPVQVPVNQTSIEVTATPKGINGFMHWRLEGEIVANQSSTIFVPKQVANSNHTLEAVFVIGTPTLQEVDVLAIGKKYVEENYGTDYSVNSVGPVGYSEIGPNGTVTYDYPAAIFRVPADRQKPGLLVYVMVNPQTGEIVKTWTSWSKSLPPTSPPQ